MMTAFLLQLGLILTNAIFACAEIAVITMNDNKLSRLASAGDKRAIRLKKLTSEPSHFLATIQVGITLAGFLGSAFAASNFSMPFTKWLLRLGVPIQQATLNIISVVVITIILSFLTLVFGELVPKRIAMQKAEQIALFFSDLMYGISKIFAPVVWILTLTTNASLKLMGFNPHQHKKVITEEEIRMMIDTGSEKGTIQKNEKMMIQNIFEFDDTPVSEIMTHRTNVVILWEDDDDPTWQRIICESDHTIYPVCQQTADHVVGVLYTKDYFRLQDISRKNVLKSAVRPPYYVPEKARANIVFQNMQSTRIHFAVVLDDYGGMSGIVTMHDLLEQLVGDLEDDTRAPKNPPLIKKIDTTTWQIAGTAPLDEVSEAIGVLLPADEYESFGGFVFGLLGSIPEDGSTPELEAYGVKIKVVKIQDHRLETAFLYRAKKKPAN